MERRPLTGAPVVDLDFTTCYARRTAQGSSRRGAASRATNLVRGSRRAVWSTLGSVKSRLKADPQSIRLYAASAAGGLPRPRPTTGPSSRRDARATPSAILLRNFISFYHQCLSRSGMAVSS
jgi:hypothetical protein